ncbi:uncharacterized protein LOC128230122 isoform X2 [Mya arenaria]|nr:uncharacterized protein LOC128230122 isoform X2 [Mya arenaria]
MITSGPSSCTFLHNILTHAAIKRKASTRLKSPVKLTQTASRFSLRKLQPIPNSRPPRETDRDHLVVESAAPEVKAWSSPRKLNQQKPAMDENLTKEAFSPKLPKQSSQDVPGYLESVKSSVKSPVCVINSSKKQVTNLPKEKFISPVKLSEDTSFSRKNSTVSVNFCKPSNLFSVDGNISSNDCDKAHAEQCLQHIQGENNNATEIALEGKQTETLVVFDHETKKRTSVSPKSKKTSAQFLTLFEPVNEKSNINDSLSKDLIDIKTVPEWLTDISDSESSRSVTRKTEKGRAFANVANADEHDDEINHDQNEKHTECEKSYVPKVSNAKKSSMANWKSKVKSDNCDGDLVSKKESKQNEEGKCCRYIVEKGSDNSDNADMPKELKNLIHSTSQILTCNESPRKSKLEASKLIHYAFESCGSCIPRSGAGRQGSDYAGGNEKIKEFEIIQRCFSELLKHTRQLELSTNDFEDCFAKEWKDHELPDGENVGRMTQSVSNTSSEFELYKDNNPFYVNNISNKKNLVQTKDKLSSDISLDTDMPSDFQVLGGDGEVLHFTKTLAERIKERGRRSVSICNATCTRKSPTDSCSVKQNISQKNKLVPYKTVASLASAKVLNKYRLHRHTGITDNVVHQSGYQGDDEKETTPKVNTLRALREKISKKNKLSERARQSDRSVPYEPSCLKNNVLVTLETDLVKEAKGKNQSCKKTSAFRKCVAGKTRAKITLENDRKKITIEKNERRRGVKIKHIFWDYVAVDEGKNPDKNVTMKNNAKELRLLQDSSLLSSDFSEKECYTQKLKRKCNSQLNKGMNKPLGNVETAIDTITKLNQNEKKKVNVETANDIVNNEKNPRRGKFWTYEIITDDSDVEESVELIPRQLKNLKCLWNNFSNSESERRCRSRERSMRDGQVIRTVNNCEERTVSSLNSCSNLESENKKISGSRKRKVNGTSVVVQDEKLEDELDLSLPREVRKLKLDKTLIARKSRSLRSCGHSPEIHCNRFGSTSLHRDKGRDVVPKTNVQYKQRSNEHAIVDTKQSTSEPLRKYTVNSKTKTQGNDRSPSPVFKSSSQNFKPIRRKSPVFNHSLISGKTKQCKISRICSHRSAQEDDKITATISNGNSGRTTPNKSIVETPKSPPGGHSITLRAERIQWKRKRLESKPESAESQQKKMKLCSEETGHFPVKTSVVKSLNKENKKAFPVSKENSNECKPFALHWSSIKRKDNGTSELEVTERVKINKMWTVLSERSASLLLSSEDDRETFEGLGGMEESLQSGLPFQNWSKQQIPVSDTHQWEIEDEDQEHESVANLVKLVPLVVSSPWKHSNSSWDEACDSMIDKSLKHSPNSSLKCLNSSMNYNFSSPKKTFLSPAKKLNSPVSKRPNTPNKRNPVHSSCIRHIDGEIEFNFGSPHKNHVAFSPLKSVNGAVVDCSKRPVLAALDSTPTPVDRRTRHQKENT